MFPSHSAAHRKHDTQFPIPTNSLLDLGERAEHQPAPLGSVRDSVLSLISMWSCTIFFSFWTSISSSVNGKVRTWFLRFLPLREAESNTEMDIQQHKTVIKEVAQGHMLFSGKWTVGTKRTVPAGNRESPVHGSCWESFMEKVSFWSRPENRNRM